MRRVSSKFRARVCISPAPQLPLPQLETTRCLDSVFILGLLSFFEHFVN